MTTESTNGDEQPTCGHPTTTTGGPCQRPVSTLEDRCYLHADDGGVPDDHGAPDGNHNRTETGLHMSVKRRIEWFKETKDYDLFTDYYVDFHGKGENKSQAAALASAAVIRDRLERHLLTDGVFYDKQIADVDELIESGMDPEAAREAAFVKKPRVQTLEAYTDAMREVRLGLDYEGVTGDSGGSGALPDGASAMWED
jgi:hypothetical protein